MALRKVLVGILMMVMVSPLWGGGEPLGNVTSSSDAAVRGTKLTSGSTSIPKAAIASEAHLINDGRHIVEAMGIGPSDVNATAMLARSIVNIASPLLQPQRTIFAPKNRKNAE